MKRNSRLYLALHTLSHMAGDPANTRTSAAIAEHAGTNPVVVRRVLGKLRKAGLLTSEKGHAGGWKLAKAPKDVSLADVYLALEEKLVASEAEDQADGCKVAHTMHNRVGEVLAQAEAELVQRLSKTSIADLG